MSKSYLTNKKNKGIFPVKGEYYIEPQMQMMSVPGDPGLKLFANTIIGNRGFQVYHDMNYFSIRENGKEVGSIDAAHIGGRVIYINGMSIEPEYRGIGLGKRFYNIAENYWKHIGAVEVLILPVGESKGFWEKLGFVETKDGWSKKL